MSSLGGVYSPFSEGTRGDYSSHVLSGAAVWVRAFFFFFVLTIIEVTPLFLLEVYLCTTLSIFK